MNPRLIYHVARADFLERTRRYGFLVTLAAMAFLVVETARGEIVLSLDQYRGVFNSAWLGLMMALLTSVLLSWFGLYLVKNTIARDESTGVGRVLAATPLSNAAYTLGKALSNFAVLASMLLVLALGAIVLQFFAGESREFHLWAFASPLLFIAVPALAFVAALAVLFETLPLMRSGGGNVLWFFLWGALVAAGVKHRGFDFTGMGTLIGPLQAQLRSVHPDYQNGFAFTIGDGRKASLQTFVWEGFEWTGSMIGWRLTWIALAIVVALLAAAFFRRFDPARGRPRFRDPAKEAPGDETAAAAALYGSLASVVTSAGFARSRLTGLVISELRLLLFGRPWWWWLTLLGCVVAGYVNSAAALAAWIWPVTVWSQLGSRESRFGTSAIIFSAPSPLGWQFLATYLAGWLCALAAGSGPILRALLAADAPALGAVLACVCFVPALALALGVWTGSGKFFEALYTAWWYAGPAHFIPGLDFAGGSPQSQQPLLFAALALGLGVTAWIGRGRQIAYGPIRITSRV